MIMLSIKCLKKHIKHGKKHENQTTHQLARDNQRDWQQQTRLKSTGGNRV